MVKNINPDGEIIMMRFLCTLRVYYLLKYKTHMLFYYLQSSIWYFSIFEKWIETIAVNHNHRVLEMGCGPGVLTRHLHMQGYDVEGIDVSEDMILYGESMYGSSGEMIKLHCQDAKKTFYKDNEFDYVIAASLVNVLDAPEDIIKEMLRVTKKNGIISILYPTEEMNMRNIKQYLKINKMSKMSEAALVTWARLSRKMTNQKATEIINNKNTNGITFHSLFDGMVSSATVTKNND